jgi:hypothetical protein
MLQDNNINISEHAAHTRPHTNTLRTKKEEDIDPTREGIILNCEPPGTLRAECSLVNNGKWRDVHEETARGVQF